MIDLARALRSAGLDVLMWAASQDQREQIQRAALELAPGEVLASATATGAELEDITTVLLLTDEDDFNALASTVLAGNPQTSVYRLAPRHPTHGVVAPHTASQTLFTPNLTGHDIALRHNSGARITTAADSQVPPGADLLFLITPEGTLHPATTSRPPTPQRGDTLVLLGPGQPGKK